MQYQQMVWKSLIGLGLLVAGSLHAQTMSIPMVTAGSGRYVLDNGVRVIVKEDHSSPLVALGVMYPVGFRNEDFTNHRTGATHLLEHMLFQETSAYEKGQISRTLTELGAQFNAYTSYNRTVYHEVLPPASLEAAMELEANRMTEAMLVPEEFEREKQVVLSEVSGNLSDPMYRLYSDAYMAIFGSDHPVSYLAGSLDDISRLERDYVYKELYQRYYQPNQATVIVVGAVSQQEAIRLADNSFGKIPPAKETVVDRPKPMPFKRGVHITRHFSAERDQGIILFPLPAYDVEDKDFVALTFVELSGLISGFGYNASIDGSTGYLPYSTESNVPYPSETLQESYVVEAFPVYMQRLLLTEATSYTSVESMMSLFLQFSRLGSVEDYNTLLANIATLQASDVNHVINRYLSPSNASTAFLKADSKHPDENTNQYESHGEFGSVDFSGLDQPDPEAEQAARDQLIGIGETNLSNLRSYLSQVQTWTLSNGMQVVFFPYQTGLQMSVYLGFRDIGGLSQTHFGQAALTMQMVFEGGPQSVWQKELLSQGVSVDLGAGQYHNGYIGIRAPVFVATQVLEYLAKSVQNRSFLPMVFYEYRTRVETQWKQSKQSTDASEHLSQMLLVESLLGGQTKKVHQASLSNIRALQLAHIEEFYQQHYVPSNAVLVFVGNLPASDNLQTVDQLKQVVQKNFGDWSPPVVKSALPELTLNRPKWWNFKKFHKLPDSRQSQTGAMAVIGKQGTEREAIALKLANEIFGGRSLSSRLMRSVRDEAGLTYGIYSSIKDMHPYAMWNLRYQSAATDASRVYDIFQDELAAYVREGPNGLERASFKRAMIQSVLFHYTDPKTIAQTLLKYSMEKGRYDYDVLLIETLLDLSADEVSAAAKRLPTRLYRAEVGSKSGGLF